MMNDPVEQTHFVCQRCSKCYKSHVSLDQHVKVCSQSNAPARFVCDLCSKRFRTHIQATRHHYYTHGEKSFACDESGCGRIFPSHSHLIKHKVTHTTVRSYSCSHPGCNYMARTPARLMQHRIVHGEGRRFACDYCDYSATTTSNLRRHARIHAGARPYFCPHCDHRTSELDALKKHVLDSGWHPGLPLYVCPWCPTVTNSGATECVGFNASELAWRHFVSEHTDEVNKYTRGQPLRQRAVTRLLGIYCPEADASQPPENVAVRQPTLVSNHRRRRRRQHQLSSFPVAQLDRAERRERNDPLLLCVGIPTNSRTQIQAGDSTHY